MGRPKKYSAETRLRAKDMYLSGLGSRKLPQAFQDVQRSIR